MNKTLFRCLTYPLLLTISCFTALGISATNKLKKENKALTELVNSSTTIKKQTDGVMEGVFSADVMNINPQYAGVPMSVYASISIVDDKVEMKGIGVAGLDMTLKYSEEDKNLYLYSNQQINKSTYFKPDYEKSTYSFNNMVFTKVDNLNLHGFYKDLDPNGGSPYFYFSNDYFIILKDDHFDHSNHQSKNFLNDYGLLTSSDYVHEVNSTPSVFKLTLRSDNTYLMTQVNDKTSKFEGADELYFKINEETNNVEMWVISGDNKILASSMRKSSIYEYDSYLNGLLVKSKQTENERLKNEKAELEQQILELLTRLGEAAGLYDAGTTTLVKTWDELISDGDITITNGQLKITNTSLSGDLVCGEVEGLTNLNSAFTGCSSLTSIDLSKMNLTAVTGFDHTFSGCSNLKKIKLSRFSNNFYTNSSGIAFAGCFSSCTALEEITHAGTIAEWKALYLKSSLTYGSLAENITVHCSDGDITTSDYYSENY